MKIIKSIVVLFLGAVVFSSCQKNDDDKMADPAPNNYEFFRNGKTSVEYSAQTIQLKQAFEIGSLLLQTSPIPSVTELENRFKNGTGFTDTSLNNNQGLRNLIAVSSADREAIRTNFDNYLKNQIAVLNSADNASKGVAGTYTSGAKTRHFNEKGREIAQSYYKGMIGAFVLDQIVNNLLVQLKSANNDAVVSGKNYTEMEHLLDQSYGYLHGIPADNATYKDRFLGHYLEEIKEQSYFAELGSKVDAAFIAARTAIVSKDYTARDVAVKTIKEQLSMVPAARGVFYLQKGKSTFVTAGAGNKDAFHALSEGYGFVYSLQFSYDVENNKKYFTKAEVDKFIAVLEKGDGFYDLTPEELTDLSNDILEKYEFNLSEVLMETSK